MRLPSFVLFSWLLIVATAPAQTGTAAASHADLAPAAVPEIEVFFSPRGGCTAAVVRELGRARKTVLVQAYSFTSAPIAKALVEAKRRGVDVRIILDKTQRTDRYSEADFTAHAGIPTFIDAISGVAHNKVIVIDGLTVITGSFNFTRAAEERNAENLLVIRDAELARKYADNWQARCAQSVPYAGR